MNKDLHIEFHAEVRNYNQSVDLFGKNGDHILQPLALRKLDSNEMVEPVRLTLETAQNLMDALYRAGIVPSRMLRENRSDIMRHLEDMRTLVFKEKNIEQTN